MKNEEAPGGARIAVIGAGRLGRALARTWPDRVVGIHDLDAMRAAEVAQLATDARVYHDLGGLAQAAADVVWIATSDRAIVEVVSTLSEVRADWTGAIVVHSAGLVPLSVLDPLADAGATVAAFHPNASVGGDEPLPHDLIWGGDARGADAQDVARRILGPNVTLLHLDDGCRALYHAAASVAANFATSLFALSELLYARAGVDASAARRLATGYMLRAVERAAAVGPPVAITGPVVRGDWDVVRAQIAAVTAVSPELAAAFESLVVLTDELFGGMKNE